MQHTLSWHAPSPLFCQKPNLRPRYLRSSSNAVPAERNRAFQVRASHSDSRQSIEAGVESLRKLKPQALRRELDNLGIPNDDCFEKEELVRRLASALASQTKRSISEKPLVCMPMKILKSTSFSPVIEEDIVVPLRIGGQGPFNFLIDTGSSVTLIRPDVAWNKLQIPRTSATRSAGIGAATPFNEAYSVPLPQVELEGHSCKPVTAVVIDLSTRVHPSAAGLMGISMISQFDVEFDFVRQKLAFYAAGAVRRGTCNVQDMEQVLTSFGAFGVPYVQVQVGSSPPQPAILDLGCSLCVASMAVAQATGLSQAALEGGHVLGGFGIGGATMPFYSSTFDISIPTLKDGKPGGRALKLKDARFALGDIPAMKVMGVQVIIGLEVFRQSRLVLSMSTGCAYLQLRVSALRWHCARLVCKASGCCRWKKKMDHKPSGRVRVIEGF